MSSAAVVIGALWVNLNSVISKHLMVKVPRYYNIGNIRIVCSVDALENQIEVAQIAIWWSIKPTISTFFAFIVTSTHTASKQRISRSLQIMVSLEIIITPPPGRSTHLSVLKGGKKFQG